MTKFNSSKLSNRFKFNYRVWKIHKLNSTFDIFFPKKVLQFLNDTHKIRFNSLNFFINKHKKNMPKQHLKKSSFFWIHQNQNNEKNISNEGNFGMKEEEYKKWENARWSENKETRCEISIRWRWRCTKKKRN